MADLFLTWDEAQGEQLPHYCVSCAAPATEWADWRVTKTDQRIFSIQYTHVDVTLPVCPQHRDKSWIYWRRVIVKQIQDDGIVLGHVSPGFVEAVWDYRDETESQPPQPPARRMAPRSHRSEFVDDYEEPLPRHPSRHGRYAPAPARWTPGKIVLMTLIVLLLAPCTLLPLIVILAGLISSLI